MKKTLFNFAFACLLFTGCANEPKLTNSQALGAISSEDKESYKDSLSKNRAIQQLHNEAKRVIAKHIGGCGLKSDGGSNQTSDRFSLVMKSYRNSK